MLFPLAMSLAALLAAPQVPRDPEQEPAGRSHYLGREVAQTMHWTGAAWLMRATREDEENGALLRHWLAVQPGQSVCDLGCGNGYHTLPLAETVGAAGKVFAVDVQPQMLTLLQQRSERRQLENIVFVEATADDPKLPPASCDLVLLVDVYHELSHPVRVMAHVRRALKPGGRVVLVEFREEHADVPIKPEHRMSKAQVVREMASHGFTLLAECDELPWQHAMAFGAAGTVGPRFEPAQLLRAFLRAAAGDDRRIVAPFLAPGLAAKDVPALPHDLRTELRAGTDGRLLADLRAADGSRLAPGRDEVVLRCDEQGRWLVEAVRATGPRRPFVAMHTALGSGPVADRIALAHELGFDGVAWDLDRLAEARSTCEALGGDLVSAYAVLDLGDGDVPGGADKRLAPVRAAIDALAGGPGMLWLALRNPRLAPRAPSGDEAAIALLRALLVPADAAGVEIALYPHHGLWLETTEDALRLCARINDAHLGVCFNLCHFLRTSDASDPAPLLARCGSRLFAVTVNGADVAGEDWTTLIRPLGEGDFDLRGFVATLDAIGFTGPVGLQGFGITQPPREHLSASMKAWRRAR
ncbi:MAG TPA: methyltransferase domain-containing protein [Planctomycetota bacterium]|nr:methyltransferase domain-containing protein [Planctomycetota bacterium]